MLPSNKTNQNLGRSNLGSVIMEGVNGHPAVNRTPSLASQVEVELDNAPMEIPDEGDLGPIITALKIGTLMAQYTKKGRFEKKTFHLNLEEFKISWFRLAGGTIKEEEGSIPIEEIKEVQRGCTSKDFASVIRKLENPDCCIVIVYGNTFKLKTLSCLAQNAVERDFWVKGLVFLKYRNQYVPPIALAHRWLCREWSVLPKNSEKKMSMREYKIFLQKANIKITTKKMREIFDSVAQGGHIIDAKQFCKAYNKLLNVPEVIERYQEYFHQSSNDLFMTPQDFQNFLLNEQKDRRASDMQYVYDIMSHVKPVDSGGDNETVEFDPDELNFTMTEFLSFLFHPMNSIFNDEHRVVYQDMTRPICQYWIASSHNTYLTGDQIQSQSSEEAYTRVLRMGSRCVELDCWDGPNNEPLIYHGFTLTSRIKLVDVLKVIANNAFAVSEYPLILSIENHCSIQQQVVMAELFQRYLGKYLVTEFLDSNEVQLPSPEALKHRIILKQKRLQSGSEKDAARQSIVVDDTILAKSKKSGVMYMKDEYDNWNKHLVVLCKNSLYSSHPIDDDNDMEEEDDEEKTRGGMENEDELHFGEKWFHRSIDRGAAEELLRDCQKGDGSFLVRPSIMFVGDFTLSFWWRGKVKHVHIKSKQLPDGNRKYSVERKHFDNLYSLINYYQVNPIKSEKIELTLKEPVPEPDAHLGKDWYHDNLRRLQAEDMLKRLRKDGYFLVRKRIPDSPNEPESYAISFRTGGTIKHCRIQKEGRLFMIGTAPFESMTELIDHYGKCSLYRKTKLKYPCNQLVVQESGQNPDNEEEDPADFYAMPNHPNPKPACRAKYDYTEQKEDELSFVKGALILNIVKYQGGWWQGDYNGQIQKWFPVCFTEEITIGPGDMEIKNKKVSVTEKEKPYGVTGVENTLDTLQPTNLIDLTGCHPQILSSNFSRQYIFRLDTVHHGSIDCSVDSEMDMMAWLTCIQDASSEAVNNQIKIKEEAESKNIAKELSDLVVYCVPKPFTDESLDGGKYYEMSSISELKMDRLVNHSSYDLRLYKYHQHQFMRVYPKGNRFDSSNYDPVPFWNFGAQMCALNYQTTDKSMQIERGHFLDNGGCGYVLQPEIFREPKFDPFDITTFGNVEPLNLRITVIAARHFPKISRGLTCPFIEIEIIGLQCDAQTFRTRTKNDNGLCPTWFVETFDFDVVCPPLAKIYFVVKHEDMFGDYSFIAQACFPITSLREGHRSVPLKNSFSEEIPLSALLLEIRMQNAQDDEEYASISVLRDKEQALMSKQGFQQSVDEAETLDQLRQVQDQLSQLTFERKTRHREADKFAGRGKNNHDA